MVFPVWVALSLQAASEITLDRCLAIQGQGRGGRIPFPTDPVVQARVDGTFVWPKEGDVLGERKWEPAKANAEGRFEGRAFSGGYAAFSVDWPRDEVVLIRPTGASMFYANDEPRIGDVYGYGYTQVPVKFKRGPNQLLVATGRGSLHMSVSVPKASAVLNTGDLTLPDIVEGDRGPYFGAVLVVNTLESSRKSLELVSRFAGQSLSTKVPVIGPLAFRKCKFGLPKLTFTGDSADVRLELREDGKVLDEATITLRFRKATQSRKVTFVSDIDGSVQYFAVQPPKVAKPGLALVLSTHGASVEAINQADAYSPKDWCWIVCPTNRRPFGFDWEDWGRLDALEVLRIAQKRYQTDARRTYVTGHSMGGHGAWQLAAHFPNLFAAVGPSAGWRSFYTYVGKPRIESPTPMQSLFERVVSPTDTELLLENYRSQEVYILHGDADDNVPVREARAMRDHFARLGQPIGYHEEPKAGHWWDGDRSPGADCVDWPEMFDAFRRTSLQRWNGSSMEFRTLDPSVSAQVMDVATVLRQERRRTMSTVKASADGKGIALTTNNVAAIRIDPRVVSLDGQRVTPTGQGTDYEKVNGAWGKSPKPIPMQHGVFKDAFAQHMAFVYGTASDDPIASWSYAKARFDAEQWWYRGNGSVDVLPDREITPRTTGRNLILYGSDSANSAWSALMDRETIRNMEREMIEPALGMAMTEAFGILASCRQGQRDLAWIGGRSLEGCRVLERLPYFSAGVAYPDWTMVGVKAPSDGYEAVLGAGFWGEPGVFRKR